MGEVVDLQSYRRRRKGRAAQPRGAIGRRPAERVQPRGDGPRPVPDSPASARPAPDSSAKVGRDEHKAD